MRAVLARLVLRIAVAAILAIAAASCDSGTYWEDEKYAVYWIDSPDNIELGIKLDDDGSSLIGRYTPISVGSDRKYLVVRDVDGYFYVVKAEDDWKKDFRPGQHGPYTFEEFKEIKKRLRLPDFEKHFDLPPNKSLERTRGR